MNLPPFVLYRPQRLDEALDLLAKFDEDAAFYMGGTELLLLMKLGFAQPGHLIDGKGLSAISRLSVDADTISIGAGVTHRRLEQHGDVRRILPALSALERHVANVRVRNAGTIGGNLCFAEPHSDPVTLLIALGATVHLASINGVRQIPLEDFWQGAFSTALTPGEIMVNISVPVPHEGTLVGYERLAFQERPTVAAAVVLGEGSCNVLVGALGARPLRIPDAERILTDSSGSDIEGAVKAVMETVAAQDSAEGADYRSHLAGVMVRRTFEAAAAGARP